MKILEVSNNQLHSIDIVSLTDADFETLSSERYFFDWQEEKGYEIVKLTLVGSSEILGLMSFEEFDDERRTHIRLLASAKENVGKEKRYRGIIGNLLAYAANKSVLKHRRMGLYFTPS